MELTLFSKPGCHLCDDMKAIVAPLARAGGHRLEVVDITTDAALLAQYGEEIPVLFVDGRKVAKHRIDERTARRILE